MEHNTPPTLPTVARKILQAQHYAPFEYLGKHTVHDGARHKTVIRVILPAAVKASIVKPPLTMQRIADSAIFEAEINCDDDRLPDHYLIEWHDHQGNSHCDYDPYNFSTQLTEHELQLFTAGKQDHANKILGAHVTTIDKIDGVLFSTWAPNAERVSVVGGFNHWASCCHAMRSRGASGIWELFIPGINIGEHYQFEMRNHHSGEIRLSSDPYAQQFDAIKKENGVVTAINEFPWNDGHWIQGRESNDWRHEPISIYEVHLASWQRNPDGALLNYRELARQLVEYVRELGFTHIELLSQSSSNNTCGYFSPGNQHGTLDNFKQFIDYCHQHRIGVILDWCIDRLPSSLNYFDGAPLYEPLYEPLCDPEDEQNGHHSPSFDYSRNGVRNFLISSALFWLEDFHLDGLKFCTSTSMLYRENRKNDDALSLLRELNDLACQNHPGILMITEENTAWPMVTQPTGLGGLGFSMKWNGGWLHDTLKYFSHETTARHQHHDSLIFSQHYAFSENFILSLSHSETEQHDNDRFDKDSPQKNRGTLLSKMPGDESQRFANLRLFYSYLFFHPGKKLLFMGNEFAMSSSWNRYYVLPWDLADEPLHRGVMHMVTDLNALYRNTQPLHQHDFNEAGFEWIDCHDSTQSLLVFRRNSDNDTVIVALNFSATAKNDYRMGVPFDTTYKEIFNSDGSHYGGDDRLNSRGMHAERVPWMKQPFSITITLPPLAALIIKPLRDIINTAATTA